MSDAMLAEIWRVREELIKKHGGWDGYVKYAQQLERAQAKRQKKTRVQTPRRRRAAAE